MDEKKAAAILSLQENDTPDSVKRKYYHLVTELHPDSAAYHTSTLPFSITDVYDAYEYVRKNWDHLQKKSDKKNSSHDFGSWHAPRNPQAYISRNIYQYAEDSQGNPFGAFILARGSYYWDHETEDFPLFMKSILHEADALILEKERIFDPHFTEEKKLYYKKELVYLLASQYVDSASALASFAVDQKTDTQNRRIYHFQASLEFESKGTKNKTATGALYPLKLKSHRLYLSNQAQTIYGYLSFPDDRLYYILVPLFENKEVQIKAAFSDLPEKSGHLPRSRKIDLWIRPLPPSDQVQMHINSKIQKILSFFEM